MTIPPFGLGGVIAMVVLVIDAVLFSLGKPPGGTEAAIMLGALAVARLT